MNIAEAVKKCAMDAMEASIPCDVLFGEVTCAEPVKIKVGDIVLPDELVLISENLRYKSQKITFSVYEREVVINEGIKNGDTLILIRQCGGERYIALGKV